MMRFQTESEALTLARHPRSLARFALCVVVGLNVASVVATLFAA
jgi:hypothetical protein